MGYFANGTQGDIYEEEYCSKYVHYDRCAVLHAHYLYNYDECEDENSILHLLIPRDGAENGKCEMFYAQKDVKSEYNSLSEALESAKNTAKIKCKARNKQD